MLIDIIYAIVIGIIEGITEWLPVSSTAHIIMVEKVFYSFKTPPSFSAEFLLMFDVLVQLGAIFAVVIIYFNKLFPFKVNSKEYDNNDSLKLWKNVILSTIPVVVIGFLFDDWITQKFYNIPTIGVMLIIYGIIFIFIENKKRNCNIINVKSITYKKAISIGLFQVLALIPGTSRSGITIIGGSVLGCDRKSSTEYSFYLSVPIMLGASIYKLLKYAFTFKIIAKEVIILMIAMLVAMLVSLIIIKKLLNYIQKHSFKVFGIYRIILGIIIIVIYLFLERK